MSPPLCSNQNPVQKGSLVVFVCLLSKFLLETLHVRYADVEHCLLAGAYPLHDLFLILHCLPTAGVGSFNEYADRVFLPYVQNQLKDTSRLDVVWDIYIPSSLKESTREKRGDSVRRKVCSNQAAT